MSITPASSLQPDLPALLSLFPPSELVEYAFVSADAVPEPYHGLLVHEHHMTVTVERFHHDLVNVQILARRQDEDAYSRKILLSLQKTGRIVQFGIVRIHLNYCAPDVQAEIVAGQTPIGRILIEHDVLRRIEPTAFVRVVPGPNMMQWFGLRSPIPTFGRLAIIHCDEQPAVELLEIVAPET